MRRVGDEGSAAIAVVMFALVAMVLAAFVIDGGLAISQRERAADVAEQAARRVANDIDIDALRTDPKAVPHIRAGACGGSAVPDVLVASEVDKIATWHCDLIDDEHARVTVTLRYRPLLTGLFFTGTVDATGTATAGPENGSAP